MNALAPGSVELFAANFVPRSFDRCMGQSLNISVYQSLFSLIGTRFGGDGRTTFKLPKLADLQPETGEGIQYLIEVDGIMSQGSSFDMSIGAGFIGEIVYFAPNFNPRGFAVCDGTSLSTTDFEELFSLIGYKYGGSGDQFNVPKIDPISSEGSSGTVSAYIRVATQNGGVYPTLASLMLWSGDIVPSKAWAFCDGKELPIADNAALFSLIGSDYGKTDRVNFYLPKIADNNGTKYIICTQGDYPARK